MQYNRSIVFARKFQDRIVRTGLTTGGIESANGRKLFTFESFPHLMQLQKLHFVAHDSNRLGVDWFNGASCPALELQKVHCCSWQLYTLFYDYENSEM